MVEIGEDVLGGSVFANLSVQVETNHVAGAESGGHFESLFESLLLGGLHVRLGHLDLEVYRGVGVVLLVVLHNQP